MHEEGKKMQRCHQLFYDEVSLTLECSHDLCYDGYFK